MFNALLVLSVVAPLALATMLGPRRALWISWPIALALLPVWMNVTIGALRIDLRTGASLGVLLGFALIGEPPSGRPWAASDWVVALLVVVQVASERNVGQFGSFTVPEIVRQWAVPYLLGRLYLASAADVARAVRPLTATLASVCTFAVFEAVTKFHPVNKILGRTYGLLEQGEGYRMGLKRSQAMTDHPIFFGMMMVLLLPWAIEAARRAKAREGPPWWRALPWMVAAALVGSVSRGPQLSALLAAFSALFFRHPRWRLALLLIAGLGGAGAYAVKEALVEELQKVAGETEETARVIVINGEEELYTGTRHRVLLFKVYSDALERAGSFGWGQQLRGIELEDSIAERFGSIDSHYVMFFLQRGYAGVAPFVLLQICTLVQLARAAWPARGPVAGLAGSLFGAMLAVDAGLFSVWFSPDFGTVWLFNCGLSATLSGMSRPPAEPPHEVIRPSEEAPWLAKFRLHPGCAPIRTSVEGTT